MKTILLLLFFSFFLRYQDPQEKEINQPKKEIIKCQTKIDFKSQVQPILQRRCSPCHFPGGKMYERLPFDTASTILMKKESILKRIKEENENNILKEFIEENKKN